MSPTYVETIAPFPTDTIRRNFTEEGLVFVVDYQASKIKGRVFLTYLSNLDLKYHVKITNEEDGLELLKAYLNLPMLVKVPELEDLTIEVLAAAKGLPCDLTFDPRPFIAENQVIIDHWISVVDSLSLYSLYICGNEEHRAFVETHEEDSTNDPVGSNFVQLCCHPKLPLILSHDPAKPPKYYSAYFRDSMFRGQNLFHYWGRQENLLYVLYLGLEEDPVGFKETADLLHNAVTGQQ